MPQPRTPAPTLKGSKPVAFILAGHNGSGKSTFWYTKLADELKMPLVNADRLTRSLLPPTGPDNNLKPWATELRDRDERWHKLSQQGVRLFTELIVKERMPFAFETVFSHLVTSPDGTFHSSKIDLISDLQRNQYSVVLLFVGLASVELSILRVATRKLQGGHDVPENKLRERFARTQQAIQLAAPIADLTLMFDNSRGVDRAFTLARAVRKRRTLYDCRQHSGSAPDPELVRIAGTWLTKVAPSSDAASAPGTSDIDLSTRTLARPGSS